jgi:DNA invertase Pin-like site-specific DNA recombinase
MIQRAAIYVRTSSVHTPRAVKQQIADLREYCQKTGWEIVAEYKDWRKGVRARPEFDRMMADAQSGKFDMLLGLELGSIVVEGRSVDQRDSRNARLAASSLAKPRRRGFRRVRAGGHLR